MPETQQVPKKGVCCSCQSLHPISRRTRIPEDQMDEFEGPFGCGEAGYYQMEPHMIFGNSGPWCEGVGTIPQAILTEQWKPFIEKITGNPVT